MTPSEQLHLQELIANMEAMRRHADKLPDITERAFLLAWIKAGDREVAMYQNALRRSRKP